LLEAGDSLEAERVLLASLALREETTARERLAEIYRRRGQLRRAELVHLEGLRRTPRDAGKLAAYAAFLEATGRPEEAERFRAAGRRWPFPAVASP
jgi:Tfp pilus assembly protein PilF